MKKTPLNALIIGLFLILAFSACKKNDPDPAPNNNNNNNNNTTSTISYPLKAESFANNSIFAVNKQAFKFNPDGTLAMLANINEFGITDGFRKFNYANNKLSSFQNKKFSAAGIAEDSITMKMDYDNNNRLIRISGFESGSPDTGVLYTLNYLSNSKVLAYSTEFDYSTHRRIWNADSLLIYLNASGYPVKVSDMVPDSVYRDRYGSFISQSYNSYTVFERDANNRLTRVLSRNRNNLTTLQEQARFEYNIQVPEFLLATRTAFAEVTKFMGIFNGVSITSPLNGDYPSDIITNNFNNGTLTSVDVTQLKDPVYDGKKMTKITNNAQDGQSRQTTTGYTNFV
jgi:hypothetical protein